MEDDPSDASPIGRRPGRQGSSYPGDMANVHFSQASASAADGHSPHTNVTASPRATLAWYWSTGASTRRIWPTSRTSWRGRTPPCVRSWCAEAFLSTMACWLATASSRGYRRMRPTGNTGRTAATRPRCPATHTRTMGAAADLAIILLEAPPRPASEAELQPVPVQKDHLPGKRIHNDLDGARAGSDHVPEYQYMVYIKDRRDPALWTLVSWISNAQDDRRISV